MKKCFKTSFHLIFILLLISIFGCNEDTAESTISIRKSGNSLGKIKQEKSDLLTGVSRAICYSGFRERANEENQLRYFNEMMTWADEMNITTFFFEAFDEPWKGDPNNPLGAEKHWGIFTVDRKPKLVMQKFYPDLIQ